MHGEEHADNEYGCVSMAVYMMMDAVGLAVTITTAVFKGGLSMEV